jgi:hypothetical protein
MAISITKVRDSLIEQLRRKGADVDCFKDQVDSYIFFTKQERKMQKSIKKNGLSYEAVSATGKLYVKDNPSVKNALLYNKQRLAILNQLGLNIDKVETEDDDEL